MARLLCVAVGLLAIAAVPSSVLAHCDTMDGPVVMAAREALDAGNVNLVLIWVKKSDEAEIRKAFERAVAVRQLSPQAKELADRYFFEMLVRVHRAGEGAPYSGLKPAGRGLGPAIPAADEALKDGSVDSLVNLLEEAVEHGVRERFAAVNAEKSFDENDVEAGRKYVQSYVSFVHYVEGIYEATRSAAHGAAHRHFSEVGAASHAD